MMWLLGALGSVRKLAGSVFSLMRAYPLQAAIIALVCLSAWLWHGKNGALKERDAAIAQTAQILAASKEAEARAIAARAAVEKRYKDIANAIDKEHDAALGRARDATDDYIRLHKVRSCPSGSTATDPNGSSASIPAEVSTSVIVDQADVRACGDLYTYAVSAHDWADGLNEPVPAPAF